METPRKSMALGFPNSDTPSDRLTTLPESIIFRIFKFLGPNQTARLSLVSTKLRRLCLNSPYLYLSADFDSNCSARYSDFCNYVVAFMKLRIRLGIPIDRFVFRWSCKQLKFNVGRQSLDTCLKLATASNVGELDIVVNFGLWEWKPYTLPGCVHECRSLRVLRLNLQKSRFSLEGRKMDSVEVFLLDSVSISDMKFGEKISRCWTSLRRLNLYKVSCDCDIDMGASSLEELELSKCTFGRGFFNWELSIGSSSLKSLSIIGCDFKGRCLIDLDCPSLMKFSVYGSSFHFLSTFKIASESLNNLVISSSCFEKTFCLCIGCPSIKQIKIDGCKFEECCHLKMNSLFLDVLTVSDCELICPDEKISESGSQSRINVYAPKLQTLTINSSDKFSYKFPLCISAPNLQAIIWKGNPVDFSYLKSLMSVENAIIDILPSCQHKSKRLACHCKLFMRSIYSVAMLLQSLKDVKSLEINVWPIELFFMQNDEPVIFKNLLHLFLLVNDSLADELPVIASFLKGLPNLITLIIKCEKKSTLLDDPNLVDLLGLCPTDFTMSIGEDPKQLKISKGTAQFVDEELIKDCNLGRLTCVGRQTAT